MIGIGTALAVGAIASAAGAGTKAVIQSKAANKAADQQVQGTAAANKIMQQGQDRLQGLYSPYVNAGAGAMGTLGRLTTPGRGARYASPGPPNVMGGAPPGGGGQGGYGYGGQMPRMQMPDGRPIQGPYPMAAGGDMMVNQPTMFLAGEGGPERASFSGAMPPGQMPPQQQMQQQRAQRMQQMQRMQQAGPAGPGPMQLSDLSHRLLQRYGPPTGPRPGGTFGQMMPPPMQGGPPQGPPMQQIGGGGFNGGGWQAPPQGPPQGPPQAMPMQMQGPQGPPQGGMMLPPQG